MKMPGGFIAKYCLTSIILFRGKQNLQRKQQQHHPEIFKKCNFYTIIIFPYNNQEEI